MSKKKEVQAMSDNEFSGEGGCYEVRNGKRVRVVEPTREHPDGNRPRDETGAPIVDSIEVNTEAGNA